LIYLGFYDILAKGAWCAETVRGVATGRRQKMLSFQAEIDAFRDALPRLLAEHHEGQFAVLKSCKVVRVLPTYEQALHWAYGQFGLDEQFFVKQVAESPVEHLTHFRRMR
jgi:hypothetical protein